MPRKHHRYFIVCLAIVMPSFCALFFVHERTKHNLEIRDQIANLIWNGNVREIKKLIPQIEHMSTRDKIYFFLVSLSSKNKEVMSALVHIVDPHEYYKNGDGIIHLVARTGSLEGMELLIRQGADVNMKTKYGWTPVLCAADSAGGLDEERKKLIEFMLKSGAHINDLDDTGKTPLDHALKVNAPEIASFIRSLGGKEGASLKK